MSFTRSDKDKLLAQTRRRCCICYKFCGVKIEVHHIIQEADGGENSLDNAIPVCFECHAEINHYNPRHPKGNKFTPEELKLHKKQWFEICKDTPEVLVNAPRNIDIGSLEGMILELKFNLDAVNRVAGSDWQNFYGCPLENSQYRRAVKEGSLLLLPDEIISSIHGAYTFIGRVNTLTNSFANTRPEGNAHEEATNRLLNGARGSIPYIQIALDSLNNFLKED
ncbi:hypothetical protein COV24_02975 [candidate division WWE3 bacterium CG10_big_fil_rev_8_21_14_0_10_32_10]|uniref:HNH nuclease domain-containing protein n=1 Tax=candidate division WWE3 bacterium CG10_big_fil_rev_8_21_14_0_10_32_10 TaxID=1975090 RepID=A0A2H0RA24_UNCKA|nr:MAG: hypothetical protein COV24_02975 [candidate division WWE3 bacterium CG10_big_fil_rev_8_21_14_0_10_32_10]